MENHYILYLKLDMEDKEVHLKPDMDMEVNLRLDMEVNLRLDMEVMQGHTMLVESEPQGAGKDTIFAELIEEAKRAASDGGTMSRFSLTVKLLQAKSYYRISNVAFNAILLILALQYPNSSIPKSYEEALSIIGRLGLGYDSIHVCPNNCVLFRKDYAKENNCPKCKASRWKDADGRRQIPEKVLRHFPLIPRLQRMFLSKEQSKEVQWHKLKRQDVENDLSHPADGDAWKDFDNIHKDFAADARNIRLGLATDGFNPYGNMSNSYSMWPVFVVPYNLPPWACMDQSNFMLALLIPGPSSPGKDFDVFMEPLMEELQELWKGVKSFELIVKLLHDKSYQGITNKAFNAVAKTYSDALPGAGLPKSFYEVKQYIKYNDLDECPVCKESRWKHDGAGGKKKIPWKVLRYFPLVQRLQRLFASEQTSRETRWHKEILTPDPDLLRHPADGDEWKQFDLDHPDFAADPRNLRLGLATDGFNPFGNMSNSYSMWPVLVTPYNQAPWTCTDQSNCMMALLIPGIPAHDGEVDFTVEVSIVDKEMDKLKLPGESQEENGQDEQDETMHEYQNEDGGDDDDDDDDDDD
ncbi:hypothetical protein QYE76_064168 [Lolium multiflorum]|uniref:Transposase n=1 Tax=Lolium multiflorum TaxID=4521 RepID=A0AAD8S7T7_LOLMU|nr:hypothetical protein QYE76_064168 [Lolium multiflorum]